MINPESEQSPEEQTKHGARSARQYDERYRTTNYMQVWSSSKLRRISQLLDELDLAPTGRVLDFGCGNGVFTALLASELPMWEIVGTDISAVALSNARGRVHRARFVSSEQLRNSGEHFDLIFSHHVLEHVENLPETLALLESLSSPGSLALHVLPCANAGSLEYQICHMRERGVDDRGRFFFEDPTHLRRLTSDEAIVALAEFGYELVGAAFGNQSAGAENWITESLPTFSWSLCNSAAATDGLTRRVLNRLRVRLFLLSVLRAPAYRLRMIQARHQQSFASVATYAALISFWPVSTVVDRMLTHAAEQEWINRRTDPRGSEMYLTFRYQPRQP